MTDKTADASSATTSDLALLARFSLLLAVGIAAAILFYWSLLALVHVLAYQSGQTQAELRATATWSTALVFGIGVLPILRFAISDLPALAKSFFKRPEEHYLMLGLVVAGSAVLLFS